MFHVRLKVSVESLKLSAITSESEWFGSAAGWHVLLGLQ
jgi:hypothetical protein